MLAGAPASESAIIYVDIHATGTPDGMSWETAFISLQAGLGAATPGDEIRVAQGTYRPGTNVSDTFALKSGVHHKGGYAGVTELDPDDFAPTKYLTILSGDLFDNDTECAEAIGDNSLHVVTAGNVNSNTILEGFVITGGNAGFDGGGGLKITSTNADLQVINCKFVCNRSWIGGGVDHGGSRSDYIDCTFENNVADGEGGAIYALEGELSLTNCDFASNSASTGGALAIFYAERLDINGCKFNWQTASEYGGAIYNSNSNFTEILGCNFFDNESGYHGGAVYHEFGETLSISKSNFWENESLYSSGGALICVGVDAVVRSCNFSDNTATENSGGAIFISADEPIIINCQFDDNSAYIGGGLYASCNVLTLINGLFFHNTASSDGGAVLFTGSTMNALNTLFAKNEADSGGGVYSSGSATTLVNCTVADNGATSTHGGIFSLGNATIRNSILWGNAAPSGSTVEQQIAVGGSAILTATYCDVMGGIGGATNKNVDPWFADPGAYNYRLRLCSPCLDSADFDQIEHDTYDVDGDPANNGDATPDLDLHIRAVDRPNIVDSGTGEYAFTDMGAFENCIGDTNRDRKVNGLDIQPFVNCLLGAPTENDACDCGDTTLDGELTLADVPCFVSVLLGVTDGCYTCAEGGLPRGIADCNENEVPDANDIADETSQDCNQNFIPDECDIANETSADIDENSVPDECQPDCNGNDVPDEKDIADEESLDCNENGIPDECERDCNSNGVPDECDLDPEDPDGDEWVSADCNANGVPDECEDDCNENGVPDDCDVDPEDPDGDEWVSPDCNENGYPDECDLSLPPGMGSYDCNENEVPDECDIADETSCDANENGVPDECDILMEECADTNEDDCCDEEESLMGGGESSQSSESESYSPCDELTESECWAVYYDWAMQQCWGPPCEASGFEQYQAARAKLTELGLPF